MTTSLLKPVATPAASRKETSSRYRNGRFYNLDQAEKVPHQGWKMIAAALFGKYPRRVPHSAIPVHPLTIAMLEALSDDAATVYRFGHSTLLLKLDGHFWLTDPVFSDRASPVQFFGPRRFHPPPMTIADLPRIKAVILSHNHYDHLDKNSIRQLVDKVEYFVTPVGVGLDLQKWGVDPANIIECDWWQSIRIDQTEFTATPAQHFSGRNLSDRDTTLWCSWVIKGAEKKLFFSGDSGYFSGFKHIGQEYGPFDLTFIETGAYNALWPDVHMTPEQSVQAHIDVRGKVMMPIHNGTFNLSFHTWDDPFERVAKAAAAQGVTLQTPVIGEPLDLHDMNDSEAWWQGLE